MNKQQQAARLPKSSFIVCMPIKRLFYRAQYEFSMLALPQHKVEKSDDYEM
jgi:hypothetical protein